ncbi:MAG: VPLPA-CTERM sorting domain-containing protein [Methyloglobulus sp.]
MKKYLIALLFGMSLMSMQTASAATLTLTETFGNGILNVPPASVGATGITGVSTWEFVLSGLGAGSTADVDLTTIFHGGSASSGSLWGFANTDGLSLSDGTYGLFFIIFPTNLVYDFTLQVSNVVMPDVPVPAAVWLFGSALMGLVGVARRKSQPALAA